MCTHVPCVTDCFLLWFFNVNVQKANINLGKTIMYCYSHTTVSTTHVHLYMPIDVVKPDIEGKSTDSVWKRYIYIRIYSDSLYKSSQTLVYAEAMCGCAFMCE